MPFVNVQTIKGIMNPEQKKELLRRMTDLIVEIEATPSSVVQSGFALMNMSRNSGVWAACSPPLKRSRQNSHRLRRHNLMAF